ncbi:hypothetical protein D9M71_725210 [compost metagenome]
MRPTVVDEGTVAGLLDRLGHLDEQLATVGILEVFNRCTGRDRRVGDDKAVVEDEEIAATVVVAHALDQFAGI